MSKFGGVSPLLSNALDTTLVQGNDMLLGAMPSVEIPYIRTVNSLKK